MQFKKEPYPSSIRLLTRHFQPRILCSATHLFGNLWGIPSPVVRSEAGRWFPCGVRQL